MSIPIIGSNIKIDVTNSKGKLNICGNDEQETREGYNLFDEKSFVDNNSEYYELENGKINSIKIDQRSTNFTWGSFLTPGTYTIITTNNCNIRVCQADSLPMNASSNTNTIASVNNLKKYTFTNSQQYVAIKLFSPSSVVPYEIGNVMIIEGTEEKTYEQYGAMPSPDFKSPVKTVKDNVNIIVDNGLDTTDNNYKSQEITVPIQEEMLEGDTFIKQNGVWYEYHTWGKLVLDGTENWNFNDTKNGYRYNYANELIKKNNSSSTNMRIYSNMFTSASPSDLYANAENSIAVNHSQNGLFIKYMQISNLDDFKNWLAEQYNAGTPVTIYYQLATPKLLPCTQDQKVVLEQMQNIILYNGVNNIYSTDEISPIFTLIYDKIINDFELYLSENGHLIIPEYDINFLVDLIESNIPSMPEAAESNVRVAGRDGDIPLNTTYEPIPFELVCYTEDNLTAKEKLIEEDKVTKFLNSIKNKTKTFAMELSEKFYKIKYSGALTTEKYPAHIKFTIPLKSSDSYAKNWIESFIIGNGTAESDTIKETGAIFTIDGPAISPKISLNDYIMEYENILLSGEQLIINSLNSTATLINASGTETNAMAYYNHEFPKIQNGTNELKVLSGIDNENQVQVKWYDLKL